MNHDQILAHLHRLRRTTLKTPSEDITPTPEHILELIRNAPSTHDWRLTWRGGNSFEIRAPHENGRENWWTAIADLHTSRENAETIFAQIIWAQANRPSIVDDPHPSVPAEVTTDIAADNETSGCKCEPQTVGVVINNQIMCGTCGRDTNLRIPDDCARCSLENYSRAVSCMGAAKAAAAFTRHVIRAHHPQLGTGDAAVSDAGQ